MIKHILENVLVYLAVIFIGFIILSFMGPKIGTFELLPLYHPWMVCVRLCLYLVCAFLMPIFLAKKGLIKHEHKKRLWGYLAILTFFYELLVWSQL